MPLLSPQDFREKAAKRRKTKDLEIEDMGTIRLRALSAGDAQQFQSSVRKAKADGKNEEEMAFMLLARSWIGEDGEPWLPEEDGIALARSLDPETYNLVAKAVLALNGLSETAIEDAEKNSAAGRNGSTPSDSPENSATPTLI